MENLNINALDNIQAEIAKNVQDFMDNPCPSCGGTGKIKAFQSMDRQGAIDIRAGDTVLRDFPHCGGHHNHLTHPS